MASQLFTPAALRGLSLANRVIVSPMSFVDIDLPDDAVFANHRRLRKLDRRVDSLESAVEALRAEVDSLRSKASS